MTRKKIRSLSLLLFLAGPGIFAATAQNPIIWADVPDPCVLRVGNNYYMSSTTMHMNPGVPIMKSTNLVNWQIVNYVYPTLANADKENLNNGQNEYGQGSWASSLVYKNGIYYVSFMSNATGYTYIYQTTNIETGTWTKYYLTTGYHDASLFFDDDGRAFLIYGAGDIKIVELTSDATAIKTGGLNKTLITDAGSIAGTGGLAAEGTHVLKINGKYYIFLISWPTGGTRTELVYRADSIDGTYQGKVLLANSGVGIAQGGVVDTPAGNWYAMLFRDSGAVGRMPYLIPMTWSTDLWPVLGSTTDTGISVTAGSQIVACDGFNSGSTPGLMWQWNHNPDNSYWSYNTARSGYLRLINGSVRADILNAKNTLSQRTFGSQSSAIVAMETDGMKDGDYAGLSAFQFYYGFVGVKMSGTSKSIVMVRGSTNDTTQTSTPVEVANVSVSQNRVYLKVSTDFRSQTDKATFYYSLDGNNWISIGSTLQMAYTLPHFMGYRFGLFTYATKSTGGYVDFDYYQLDPAPVGGCSIASTPTPLPPTVTRTATPSFTPTPTSTRSFTATSTVTGTWTFTPTSTRTSTPAFTLSATSTWSRTPTFTSTSTATRTATPSTTSTNTATCTSTYTSTPSATASSTSSPTATSTKTNTPTSTSTTSFTPSYSPTWTSTPTSTVTTTFTVTRTNTPTSTPTSTSTASFTSSSTSTPTSTSTGVSSATKTQTFTPTAVPPTATATDTRTSTLTSTVTETASSTNTMVPSPTATPTLTVMAVPPTATDTWTFTATSTRTMTSTSTLTATSTDSPVPSATPTLTWTATPSVTASFTFTETATWSGTSTATGTYTLTGTPTFSSTPTMTATWTASSTATSTHSMTATSTPSATFTATRSFTPTVTATWTASRTGTATSTVTATPTFTATSTNVPSNCPAVTLSAPYPNPATCQACSVRFDLMSTCPKTLHWTITTTASRLVVSGTLSVFGRGTLVWDQRDNRGKLVANGLYYFRLLEAGQTDQRAKILILH